MPTRSVVVDDLTAFRPSEGFTKCSSLQSRPPRYNRDPAVETVHKARRKSGTEQSLEKPNSWFMTTWNEKMGNRSWQHHASPMRGDHGQGRGGGRGNNGVHKTNICYSVS